MNLLPADVWSDFDRGFSELNLEPSISRDACGINFWLLLGRLRT